MGAGSAPPERVRTAEIIAAACLATDLGMGFPFEHGLRGTRMAMGLARRLGVDRTTESQTYYASLLMYSGCTTDADIAARIFAGSRTEYITPVQFGTKAQTIGGVMRALPPPGETGYRRALSTAKRFPAAGRFVKPHFAALCEVAEMMAKRFSLPDPLQQMFVHLTERWDGKGMLKRAEGEQVPLPLRIVHVARDAAYQQVIGGPDHAVEVVRERAGAAFDPAVSRAFLADAHEIMAVNDEPGSAWEPALAEEPEPRITLEGEAVERALAAIGDFADLASPYFSGHSSGSADLATAAARARGFDADAQRLVRRAAFVHDVGRVAVDARVWHKTGPLVPDELEQIRLHPYHTERILLCSPLLAPLADTACAHHERLDGSGYHRRLGAAALSGPARLLAAADTFHALRQARATRPARSPEDAAAALADEASEGHLDPVMVAAVVEAAGQPAPRVERPSGLTEREAEVVGLVARGLQTKQIARRLGISIKTADRHIQNSYRKLGVSTRAAATLLAMEHGLVTPPRGAAAADPAR